MAVVSERVVQKFGAVTFCKPNIPMSPHTEFHIFFQISGQPVFS